MNWHHLINTIRSYIALCRLNRSYKSVLVIIASLIACIFCDKFWMPYFTDIIKAFISVSIISSSNYIINEWFDKETDFYHPINKQRILIHRDLRPAIILGMYLLMLIAGLLTASFISRTFLTASLLLAFSGIIYNVKPLRFKDIVFIDVLFDSISSPIRFSLGWFIVSSSLPPLSFLLLTWFIAMYFMTRKRYAEWFLFSNVKDLPLYRKSFLFYSPKILKKLLQINVLCLFLTANLTLFNLINMLI